MSKKITIDDIAEKLSISASTVSRALNNNSNISLKTKNAVLKAAKELGFGNNFEILNSSLEYKKTIAIVVPDILSEFYSNIIHKLNLLAEEKGYALAVFESNNSDETEKLIIKQIADSNFSAVAISLNVKKQNIELFSPLTEKKIPIVLFNRVNFEFPFSKILTDNYMLAYKATKHLISVGCKRIGFPVKYYSCIIYEQMLQGYKDALKECDIEYDDEYVVFSELSFEDIINTHKILFSLPQHPDGLILPNANAVVWSQSFLNSYNLNVPNDIALLSISEDFISPFVHPTITSMDVNTNEYAEEILRSILKQINNSSLENKTTIIPPKLIIRNSTLKSYEL